MSSYSDLNATSTAVPSSRKSKTAKTEETENIYTEDEIY